MQHYDIILKSLLGIPQQLIKLLTGQEVKRLLNIELPEIRKRIVDLLFELKDGTIFHLELQAFNDPEIAIRMLEYYILLKKAFPGRKIKQLVLYVGDKPLNMLNKIIWENFNYYVEIKNIREIDCELLMSSDNIVDKILAVLCNIEDEARYVIRTIEAIKKLPVEEREDALKKLLTLSRLRPILFKEIEKRLKEEKMPLTIEIENDPLYIEGMQKGKEEGRREGREEGRKKGREEGKYEARIEIAKTLYRLGDDLEKISIVTGLSIEELRNILKV